MSTNQNAAPDPTSLEQAEIRRFRIWDDDVLTALDFTPEEES